MYTCACVCMSTLAYVLVTLLCAQPVAVTHFTRSPSLVLFRLLSISTSINAYVNICQKKGKIPGVDIKELWPASKISTWSTTTAIWSAGAPAQWPSVQDPGAQAGLPTAIQAVSQGGESSQTHTANSTLLPSSALEGLRHKDRLSLLQVISYSRSLSSRMLASHSESYLNWPEMCRMHRRDMVEG